MGDLMRREGEQKKITILWVLLGFVILLFSGIAIPLSLRKDTKNDVPNVVANSPISKITDKLVYLQRPGGFLKFTYDLESGIVITPELILTTKETLRFDVQRTLEETYQCFPRKDQAVNVTPNVINGEIALLSTNGSKFNNFVDLNSATVPSHDQKAWLVFIDQGYIFKVYRGVLVQENDWGFTTTDEILLDKKTIGAGSCNPRATYLGGAVVDDTGNFVGMATGPAYRSSNIVRFITAAEIKALLTSLNIFFVENPASFPGRVIIK